MADVAGFPNLLDRAARLLAERGTAGEEELTAHLFGGDAPGWRSLLIRVLSGDERFVRAAAGWSLKGADPAGWDVSEGVALVVLTNGPQPYRHHVVAIAAVVFGPDGRREWHSAVRPERRVRLPEYLEKGGLDAETLDAAPTFAEIAPSLIEFIGERPLVGLDVGMAVAFLQFALRRTGLPELANPLLELANAAPLPQRTASGRRRPDLTRLARWAGVPVPERKDPLSRARTLAAIAKRALSEPAAAAPDPARRRMGDSDAHATFAAGAAGFRGGQIPGELAAPAAGDGRINPPLPVGEGRGEGTRERRSVPHPIPLPKERGPRFARRHGRIPEDCPPLNSAESGAGSEGVDGGACWTEAARATSATAWRPLRDHRILDDVPEQPGVYRFVSAAGEMLYVGKATNLRERVASYVAADLSRTRQMSGLIAATQRVEVSELRHPLEAALLELRLIQQETPRYNVQQTLADRLAYVCADLTAAYRWRAPGVRVLPVPEHSSLGPLRATEARRIVSLAKQAHPWPSGRGRRADRVSRRVAVAQALWEDLQRRVAAARLPGGVAPAEAELCAVCVRRSAVERLAVLVGTRGWIGTVDVNDVDSPVAMIWEVLEGMDLTPSPPSQPGKGEAASGARSDSGSPPRAGEGQGKRSAPLQAWEGGTGYPLGGVPGVRSVPVTAASLAELWLALNWAERHRAPVVTWQRDAERFASAIVEALDHSIV